LPPRQLRHWFAPQTPFVDSIKRERAKTVLPSRIEHFWLMQMLENRGKTELYYFMFSTLPCPKIASLQLKEASASLKGLIFIDAANKCNILYQKKKKNRILLTT